MYKSKYESHINIYTIYFLVFVFKGSGRQRQTSNRGQRDSLSSEGALWFPVAKTVWGGGEEGWWGGGPGGGLGGEPGEGPQFTKSQASLSHILHPKY